jgi:hypothetical protein
MALDVTALCCRLDDFCKAFEDWEAHRRHCQLGEASSERVTVYVAGKAELV